MTMTDLTVRTLGDSTKKIAPETVAALRSNLRGTVALPGEEVTTRPVLSGTQ